MIPLHKYPTLFQHHSPPSIISFDSLPIQSHTLPLHDIKQKPITWSSQETIGKGDYTFTLTRVPFHLAHAGYISKNASQLIGFGNMQFKTRYLVLLHGVLSYYEHELNLGSELAKGTMKCQELKTFQYGPDKTSGQMTLYLADNKGQEWYIRWLDNNNNNDSVYWLRKIAYSCPKSVLESIQSIPGGYTYKEQALSYNSSKGGLQRKGSFSSESSNNVTFVDVKNKGKLGRRASHFFNK